MKSPDEIVRSWMKYVVLLSVVVIISKKSLAPVQSTFEKLKDSYVEVGVSPNAVSGSEKSQCCVSIKILKGITPRPT